ncbi:MAG: transposase [Moorea sp. SIO2B7]|nr:transposase [Moorena sp. SIO2B7]
MLKVINDVKKINKLQHKLRKKSKFNNNWYQAQLQIAKLHFKIANLRKNTLHKLTTCLAKKHDTIVIEELNVSGMMANRQLAKVIQYLGFYVYRII